MKHTRLSVRQVPCLLLCSFRSTYVFNSHDGDGISHPHQAIRAGTLEYRICYVVGLRPSLVKTHLVGRILEQLLMELWIIKYKVLSPLVYSTINQPLFCHIKSNVTFLKNPSVWASYCYKDILLLAEDNCKKTGEETRKFKTQRKPEINFRTWWQSAMVIHLIHTPHMPDVSPPKEEN